MQLGQPKILTAVVGDRAAQVVIWVSGFDSSKTGGGIQFQFGFKLKQKLEELTLANHMRHWRDECPCTSPSIECGETNAPISLHSYASLHSIAARRLLYSRSMSDCAVTSSALVSRLVRYASQPKLTIATMRAAPFISRFRQVS